MHQKHITLYNNSQQSTLTHMGNNVYWLSFRLYCLRTLVQVHQYIKRELTNRIAAVHNYLFQHGHYIVQVNFIES